MSTAASHKTACILCYVNCGLEIAERLNAIRAQPGGYSFGCCDGGSQGDVLGGPYGFGVMRAIGASLVFNALSIGRRFQNRRGKFPPSAGQEP